MVDTDFAWRLTQGLVRIDSSDPGAYEGEIERYIKALVEAQLGRLSHPVLHAVQVEELEVLYLGLNRLNSPYFTATYGRDRKRRRPWRETPPYIQWAMLFAYCGIRPDER